MSRAERCVSGRSGVNPHAGEKNNEAVDESGLEKGSLPAMKADI